jgi:hypothetical protein
MRKKRINFLGRFYPGIGLGIIISYEEGNVYFIGFIPFYQFYLDIKIF